MQKPYILSTERVLKNHETSPQQGLTTSDATRLLSEYGTDSQQEKGVEISGNNLLHPCR